MKKKRLFAYAKIKTQIKLISVFVFAIWIVRYLFFLNPKFHASIHLLCLYSPVCVGRGRKPEDRFSHNEAHLSPAHTDAATSWRIILLQLPGDR